MSTFEHGQRPWLERLGRLRNVVRQEVIRRQLAEHVEPGSSVLDIGCGQGTQAIALAKHGCSVTAIEPLADMRSVCERSAADAGVNVAVLEGTLDSAHELFSDLRFDVVCAHGVFMYLDDPEPALATMRALMTPGGTLSFTVRNGDALAMRHGVRGDWQAAVHAFDHLDYVNELGVSAKADRHRDVTATLDRLGLDLVAWYGVRVLTDHVSVDQDPPGEEELLVLLDAEEIACSRDPYRWMGSQFHFLAEQQR